MKSNVFFRALIILIMCISLAIPILPQAVQASEFSFTDNQGGTYSYHSDGNSFGWTYSWSSDSGASGTDGSGSGQSSSNQGSYNRKRYQYEKASNIDELIEICKKYSDRNTITGVRNQINWMNQLYSAAVQDFVGHLGLGETLLLAVLNHEDINATLFTSPYSIGDINREVARKITEGAEGYVDVDAIAKATGLKAKDVRSILERIAAGGITEKTIAVGKNRTRASSHGVYVNNQALKQDKVWQYLTDEVERMTGDSASLTILYQDLGAGYVDNLLSGYDLDKYKVSLYKEHLAKILDKALDSENPINMSTITKSDPYKITKKAQTALSKLYKYEMAIAENNLDESLSEELIQFLEKHKENGIFTESEAREYLILSGQYEEGERGIGEASKLLSNSYKHLKGFESALKTSGKVFSAVETAKKVQEFVDYLVEDYGKQEILLDDLVETLSDSGADMELLVAAKELKQEYESKLSGTFDKMYSELIDKGIGTVKSTFPPLGIAEACISLTGTITGGDDIASALEAGLAMQGICKQALEDYENAVIAVNEGDTGDEAVSRVISTFEIARQSLVSYYKAMVTLADTETQENTYAAELKKLEKAEFGYVTVSLPFDSGSAGVHNNGESEKESLYWYELAAEQGFPKAYLAAALNGYIESEKRANELVEKAKQAGLFEMTPEELRADGCVLIGFYYYSKQNYNYALEWFTKSAGMGCSVSMYFLGDMYYSGTGVKQDIDLSLEWLEKAADLGDVYAMHYLGTVFQILGSESPENSFEQKSAVEWYQKAAEAGYPPAMNQIGYHYYSGLGVTKNQAQALQWFQKGANAGNDSAMYWVGWLKIEKSRGIDQEIDDGMAWCMKAYANGNENAAETINWLLEDHRGLNGYFENYGELISAKP